MKYIVSMFLFVSVSMFAAEKPTITAGPEIPAYVSVGEGQVVGSFVLPAKIAGRIDLTSAISASALVVVDTVSNKETPVSKKGFARIKPAKFDRTFVVKGFVPETVGNTIVTTTSNRNKKISNEVNVLRIAPPPVGGIKILAPNASTEVSAGSPMNVVLDQTLPYSTKSAMFLVENGNIVGNLTYGYYYGFNWGDKPQMTVFVPRWTLPGLYKVLLVTNTGITAMSGDFYVAPATGASLIVQVNGLNGIYAGQYAGIQITTRAPLGTNIDYNISWGDEYYGEKGMIRSEQNLNREMKVFSTFSLGHKYVRAGYMTINISVNAYIGGQHVSESLNVGINVIGLPDLAMSVRVDEGEYRQALATGGIFNAYLTATNVGYESAGACKASLFVNNEKNPGEAVFEKLPVGESKMIVVPVSASGLSGITWFSANIDVDNVVQEIDESQNNYGQFYIDLDSTGGGKG